MSDYYTTYTPYNEFRSEKRVKPSCMYFTKQILDSFIFAVLFVFIVFCIYLFFNFPFGDSLILITTILISYLIFKFNLLKYLSLLPIALVICYVIFKRDQALQDDVDVFFNDLRIIGHRGSNEKAPENTIAAFLEAYNVGADGIEFDVTLSSDKIPVIIHDDTLDRTCNATGHVGNFNASYLKTLDCGIVKIDDSERHNIHRMPLLDEVVKFSKKRNMKMIFDIKDYSDDMIDRLSSIFEKENIYQLGMVSSFFPQVIYKLKRKNPRIITGYTWGAGDFSTTKYYGNFTFFDRTLDYINVIGAHSFLGKFLGANILLTKGDDITPYFVKQQQFLGLRIGSWTINFPETIKWMIDDLNILVVSDYPSMYKKEGDSFFNHTNMG
uniref:Glycerophosphodiester phosphodiesterase 1 (inferred by orthology to a human protein) n=1 Tax=Strongyloides venezuelensis TaxID=75913 RepID=A0A0K0F3R4_STRVS